MGEWHSYDSNNVSINLMGVLVESGFAEGELIRITMAEDAYKAYVGADGGVSRSATHNRLAQLELRLAQTSPTNAALSALLAAGVVGPVEIADLNGASLHTASKCWITKAPDVMYNRDIEAVVWKLEAADMVSTPAGQVA